MQEKININIAVDVVAALSKQTLNNHIFIMDNSISNSSCQGTSNLITSCQPGQIIQWVVYAIDLQTPVVIKNISFIDRKNDFYNKEESNSQYSVQDNLDSKTWTGIVPWYMTPHIPYRYRLEIQMGEGQNSIMSIDMASLMRV